MHCTTRRQFTASLAALAATGCAHRIAPIPHSAQAPVEDTTTLRGAAAAHGLLAGCAVNVHALRKDIPYAALIATEANIVVAENAMKFGPLRPTPTTFFFDDADFLATFAAQQRMKLRGHNLVWNQALPAWFASYVTAANAQRVLVNHIQTVAGHFRGRMHSWDVVNEAIEPQNHLPNGLRNSPWQRLLPGYIDIAFRTTRAADPHALLVYNDYGLELENPEAAAKRAAVLALLRGMQDRNVPIDAVGLQSHLNAGDRIGPGLIAFLADIRALGLKFLITEMDVNDRNPTGDVPTRDAIVAETYTQYLTPLLAQPHLLAVLTWGITDRYSWFNARKLNADKLNAGKLNAGGLNAAGPRPDSTLDRCLPFDADLQPKSAFSAELAALNAAPLHTAS